MIRNRAVFDAAPPAGFDGEFLWDFLKPAWQHDTTGIEPMDFDGVVERYANFLVFETKSPGTKIPRGQRRTLRTAVRNPDWTVVFCPKHPRDIREWWVLTSRGVTRHTGDAYALRAWCAEWFTRASQRHDPAYRQLSVAAPVAAPLADKPFVPLIDADIPWAFK